jgi:hypothetical protein
MMLLQLTETRVHLGAQQVYGMGMTVPFCLDGPQRHMQQSVGSVAFSGRKRLFQTI